MRPLASAPPSATGGFDRPLSAGQRGVWTAERLGADRPADQPSAFVVGRCWNVAAVLDPAALTAALRVLADRHELLSAAVHATAQGPVWRATQSAVEGVVEVWDGVDDARLREFHTRPFDLSRPPALRIAVAPGPADGQSFLALCVHHLVCDGPGVNALAADLAEAYAACVTGSEPVFSRPAARFGDYLDLLRDRLASPAADRTLKHWRSVLSPPPPPALPPTDLPRPAAPSFRGGTVAFHTAARSVERLEALARRERTTPFVVLLSVLHVLLGRSAGQDDVTVGVTVSGRPATLRGSLVGMTANLLPVRADLAAAASFADVVRQVRGAVAALLDHGWMPLESVLDALRPARDPSVHAVFQVLLTYDDERAVPPLAWAGAPALPVAAPESWAGSARADLTFALTRDAAGLRGRIEYNADLYLPRTAHRIAGWLAAALDAAGDYADAPLAELPLLTAQERERVLAASRGPVLAVPDRALHELVAEQAARTPRAPAVVGGGGRLSYGELDARADLLAGELLAAGVGPQEPVGVHLERSPEMVVAVLAVLKAGGAYLPLDPAYPAARLAYMISDSGARVVVTEQPLPAGAGIPDALRALSPRPASGPATADSAGARLPRVRPDRLAYLIYTSGSTGTPKGVQIEHRNAVNLVTWAARHFPAGALDAVLAATSLCFDLSVFELFAPLATGGMVVLSRDLLELVDGAAAPPSLLNTVPSALAEVLGAGALPESAALVNLAGEPVPASLLRDLADAGVAEVRNLYGPTETTTYSTAALLDPREAGRVPIGAPIGNTSVYLLDPALRPVPDGMAGEIVIGGAGVARGYRGAAGPSALRFVPDPYSGAPGARMYRTGDRGRRRPDGALEFLGRQDGQIKLRGFRIELGEVEAALGALPGVRRCAAAVRDDADGQRLLCAYLSGTGLEPERIRELAGETLPRYMLPDRVLILPELPLLPNGKVDRGALPAPRSASVRPADVPDASGQGSDRGGPADLVEQVWREVLRTPRVARDRNFFDQGGTSLLLIQMHAAFAARGVDVPISRLLRHTTVRALAAYLGEQR